MSQTKAKPSAQAPAPDKAEAWAIMGREFGSKFHGLRCRLAEVAVGEADLAPLDAQMFRRMKELGLR